MSCSSCSRKKPRPNKKVYDVMAGYKYLPDNQIRVRLEVFKKRHCKNCNARYKCDFVMYTNCDVKQQ